MALPAHAQSTASSPATSTLKPDAAPRSKGFEGDWNFAIGGISSANGKDNEAAAFFYGSANLDYKFAPWLRTHLSPRMSLFSSRVQERYDDSGEESRLWMADGYVSVAPIKEIELRAGALNQHFLGTSMLVSSLRAFPGVQEIVKTEFNNIKAALVIQQAIPTSHSLNTERESEEKLPTFMTESLVLSGKNLGWLEWKASGGLFDWSNIPDKVVADSRLVGNVGEGEITPGSRFTYDHEGWFAAGEFCFCTTSPYGAIFEFERIRNMSAPGDSADAQLIGIGPRIAFGDTVLDIRFRKYFIESDATVAAYNKSRFGNTNRDGYNIEANLNFRKEGFSLFAEGYQAEPINRDPNQRDLSIYYIGVETDYVPF